MERSVNAREHSLSSYRSITLPPEVKARSLFWITAYAAKPFVLIGLAVVLLEALEPWLGVPLAMLSMLAAQRHFQTLVHDASHLFFHSRQRINDALANWVSAGWVGMAVGSYRKVHLQHHVHNGSTLDPEHVSFETVRNEGGLLYMILRYVALLETARLFKKYFANTNVKSVNKRPPLIKRLGAMTHIAVCQGMLFIVLASLGFWWAYLIWIYLAVTMNPLLSRLGFLAEHPGEGEKTVTTLAPFYEKLFFAPQSFNYHCEHHGWPMVPPYRLARLHRHLRDNVGFYEERKDMISPSFVIKLIEQDQSDFEKLDTKSDA